MKFGAPHIKRSFLNWAAVIAVFGAGLETLFHSDALKEPSHFKHYRVAQADSVTFRLEHEIQDLKAEVRLRFDRHRRFISSASAWFGPHDILSAIPGTDPGSQLAVLRITALGREDSLKSKFEWPSGKQISVVVRMHPGPVSIRVQEWKLFGEEYVGDSSTKDAARWWLRFFQVLVLFCAVVVAIVQRDTEVLLLRIALEDAIEEFVREDDPEKQVRRRFLRLVLIDGNQDSIKAAKAAGLQGEKQINALLEWYGKTALEAVTQIARQKVVDRSRLEPKK